LSPTFVERDQQGPQQRRQCLAFRLAKAGEQRLLAVEQVGEGGVYDGPAAVREGDEDAAAVAGIRLAVDEPRVREAIDPVGHGPRGDQGRAQQRPRRELEGRPGPAQRGEHVELPRLKAVRGERAAPRDVQVPAEPGDPAQHLERLDIEIRPLAPPRCYQVIDLVRE
jgi:hypothetical protein